MNVPRLIFKKNCLQFLILIFLINLGYFGEGCVWLRFKTPLKTLLALKNNQQEIDRYIWEQRKKFSLLEADIINGNLNKGQKLEKIIEKYGFPVIIWQTGKKKKNLYRDPLDFFPEKWIYLFFDQEDKLEKWEYFNNG